MALFDGLTNYLGRLLPQRVVNLSSPPIWIGQQAAYPDPSSLAFIRDVFSGNGSVYTIVSTAARKFGYIPRFVYQIKDKSATKSYKSLIRNYGLETKRKFVKDLLTKAYNEDMVDNDFARLLAKPNDTQGQDAFYELILVYYLVTGEAFIWKNRGDIEGLDDAAADKIKPVELFIMPSQFIEVVADPDDAWGVLGYSFVNGGKRIPLRKNDVIHWKKPNPNYDEYTHSHLRGLSPLVPGRKFTTQDDAAVDAMVAMHQNDGAKGALYSKDLRNLEPKQETQLRKVIQEKINTPNVKGAVAALQGEWGYLDFGASAVDMQLSEAQDANFVKLCNLFGVNPDLFSASSKFENKEQARKDLVTNLLLPSAASLRDEMNRSLLPDFGLDSTYTHDVDVSNLPELQDDMSKKVSQLAQAWWLTPNQKLEEMNQDRSTDENMDKIWIPNNLMMMDDAAMTDTLNSFNEPTNQGNSGGDLSNL